MGTTISPPGELVPAGALHAGDTVLIPDHGTLVLVVLIVITHGTTGDGRHDGRNLCICAWQACADPSVHDTTALGSEDTVRRVHEGLAA
jgi:hypothetical protein